MSHNDDSFPSVVNASSTPGREYPLLRTNDNELPNNFFTEALKVFHRNLLEAGSIPLVGSSYQIKQTCIAHNSKIEIFIETILGAYSNFF